jgi:ketosteroid isomerase-like protein
LSSNVERLEALMPGPDTDMVGLIRDDTLFASLADVFRDLFHPDVVSVPAWQGSGLTYSGLGGFREMWLDWLEPWAGYRTQVEEMFEMGDRVVVLVRDHGRRVETDVDVELISGSVWTFRDGKIARVEFYRNRDELREANELER